MENLYVNLEIREKLIEFAVQGKTTTYSRLNTDSDTGYNFQDPSDREDFNEDIEYQIKSDSQIKNEHEKLKSFISTVKE